MPATANLVVNDDLAVTQTYVPISSGFPAIWKDNSGPATPAGQPKLTASLTTTSNVNGNEKCKIVFSYPQEDDPGDGSPITVKHVAYAELRTTVPMQMTTQNRQHFDVLMRELLGSNLVYNYWRSGKPVY